MAEVKKYLDTTALGTLVEQIKAEDAKVKAYVDSLATNYDEAGAASTAESNAKAYAKEYADGKDAAIAEAKAQADKGVADAATAAGAAATADGKAVAAQAAADAAQAAADAAQAAADAAQGDVTALAGKVGEVAEGQTVMGIIKNIQESAYDDTEIRGLIGDNADAIAAMDEAYQAADSAIDERLVEVEAFFKLAEGEQLDTALDTLKEIQTYITSEGAEADQMVLNIAANAKAIEDEAARAAKAEGDIETAYKAADAGIIERLEAVEAELGEGEGTVTSQIAAAKQEAIEAAAGDATSKANAAETAAKGHADGLNTAMNARVEALEAIDHSHANQAELDLIASGDKAKWDAAAAQAHTHANEEVLGGITAEKVAAWDTVGSKASQADLEALDGRVTANEGAIASFVAITPEEVTAAFAASNA